jgi:hypothetical protein
MLEPHQMAVRAAQELKDGMLKLGEIVTEPITFLR